MKIVLRRLLETLCAILLAIILISASEDLISIDFARVLLGTKSSEAEAAVLREHLGIDRPLPERIVLRITNTFQGDIGQSYMFRQPVSHLVFGALKNSLALLIPALLFGSVSGIVLGILSAYFPGKAISYLMALVFSLALMPSLILGTLVVYGLSYELSWLKPTLTVAIIVLGLIPMAVIGLATYQEYTKILASDYIRAARSLGVSEWRIVLHDSLRVAAINILANFTYASLYLFTGTVFIEIIFNLPGLGNLLLTATERFDFPIITGTSIVIVIFFGLWNALSGVALYVLDPRTR